MFFDREVRSSSQDVVRRDSRLARRGLALALAVAATAPVAGLSVSVWGNSAELDKALIYLSQNAKPTDPELLAQGLDQLLQGKLEEAQATLQQVKPEGLPQGDQEKLTGALKRVEDSLMQRKQARAAFEAGEKALGEKNYAEAIAQYKAASENQYADAATKEKATAQMAVAQAAMGSAPAQPVAGEAKDLKSLYKQAVAEEKRGELDAARAKFVELAAAGYRVGMFEKSPEKFVQDIDKKIAKAKAAEQPQPEPQPQPQPQPPATQPAVTEPAGPTSKELYEQGVQAWDRKDYAEAKKLFAQVAEAGYKPQGLFKRDPQEFLRRIDRELEKQAMAAAQPQPDPQPPATQPAVTEPAGPTQKEQFAKAVEAWDRKDYAEAKKLFEPLAAAGYKPTGMFQRSPEEFIKKIDAELAKAEPVAVNPPATQPAVTEPPVTEPAGPTQKEQYAKAVEAWDRKDYAEAKKLFEPLAAAGYKPRGMFQRTPQEFLTRIEAELAKNPPVAVVEPPATKPVVAAETRPAGPSQAELDLAATATLEKLRKTQRAAIARDLVSKAIEAERDNRLQEAYLAYRDASQSDPTNQDAKEGVQRTQQKVVGGTANLVEAAIKVNKIKREITDYHFNEAITKVNRSIEAKDFGAARTNLDHAKVVSESSPESLNADQAIRYASEIASARTRIDLSEKIAKEQSETEIKRTAEEAAIRAEQRRKEELRNMIQLLTSTAKQQIYDGQYIQAIGVLNQILALDPTNDYAIGVKDLVQDRAMIQEQRMLFEKGKVERLKQLNATEEKKIPYNEVMQYPDNWPDISERRDREVMAEKGGTSPQDLQVQASLDRPIPEVKLEDAQFSEVIEFLREMSGTNIFVNWKTLEAAGIEKSAKVSARLRNVKFSKALTTILNDVGGANVKLSYTVDEGVITISTAEDLNKNTLINVYDIRDLLVIAPDFDEPPDFNLANESNAGTGRRGGGGSGSRSGGGGSRGGGGGGGGGLFGGGGGGGGGSTASNAQRTEELVTEIQTLIKETVDRESWVDNGGKFGQLKFLQGQLIVTQTPENHRKLVSLLDKLRESKAIQVSIETRFLTVQRNFLEDVGIDLDFVFNIKDPNNFSPIVVSQNHSAFTANPVTNVPGSIGSSEGPQPAMTIQGSFLDDFQVNFLIRATQAAVNSTTLTAPRVTVFNGQQAYVVVAQQQAYISDLEAVTGDGVGLFNPIIDTVNTGVRLVVQPTVSADRKYVTLSLQPQVAQLVDLVDFPVFGIANDNGGNNDNNGGGGDNQVFQAAVQLPILDITAINTIVSVPDGGTLLLGGQTLAGEIEIEEGVPVLSKIPFLKRLFTNKSTAKDERILLVLVKPTIIIQREIEQQQFPLYRTKNTLGQ